MSWTIPGGTRGHGKPPRHLRGYSDEAERALREAPDTAEIAVYVNTRWAQTPGLDGQGKARGRADRTAVRTDATPVTTDPELAERLGRVLATLPGVTEAGVYRGGKASGPRPHAYVVRRLAPEEER